MSKEAMKLALEALEAGEYYIDDLEAIVYAADDLGTHEDRAKMQAAITVLRLEIDALNMASKTVKPDFWEGYVPEPVKSGEGASATVTITLPAQQALDKKAENARELGLDYEPAQYSDIVSDGGLDPRNKFDKPAQQEPIAWRVKWPAFGGGYKWVMVDKPTMVDAGFVNEALYTSPPAQRKPLTDEEIIKCWGQVSGTRYGYVAFARAIEAAHGIKENT